MSIFRGVGPSRSRSCCIFQELSSKMIVIPTEASHSIREWEAKWRDLLFSLG